MPKHCEHSHLQEEWCHVKPNTHCSVVTAVNILNMTCWPTASPGRDSSKRRNAIEQSGMRGYSQFVCMRKPCGCKGWKTEVILLLHTGWQKAAVQNDAAEVKYAKMLQYHRAAVEKTR